MGAADFVPKNGINGINATTMVFMIVALQLCMGVWLVVPKGVASEKGQNQQNSKNSKITFFEMKSRQNSDNSKNSKNNRQKPNVKSRVPLIQLCLKSRE